MVPEPESAEEWARKFEIDKETLHSNKMFRKYLLNAMTSTGKINKLNSLEQVKSIFVAKEPFSVDNGLLTPTMKNKRPELRRFFKEAMEQLYKEGPLS